MYEPMARALRILCYITLAIIILAEVAIISDYIIENNKPKHVVTYDKEAIYKRQQEKRDAYNGRGPKTGTINHSRSIDHRGRSTIKVNGATITLDIPPERIIEQLDIDYNDIRDYYGDELR